MKLNDFTLLTRQLAWLTHIFQNLIISIYGLLHVFQRHSWCGSGVGTRQQLAKLTTAELPLLSALTEPSSAVLDLRVDIDNQLTMADHVAALRRLCLFQPRQLRMVRSSLTSEVAKTLVHAFVSSRLDYRRPTAAVYFTGSVTACWRNCRLYIMQKRVSWPERGSLTHIRSTSVLRQLHWLPVRHRISFKLAMITYKCVHSLAPSYLADVYIPVSFFIVRRRQDGQLRSADSGSFVVPRRPIYTVSQKKHVTLFIWA